MTSASGLSCGRERTDVACWRAVRRRALATAPERAGFAIPIRNASRHGHTVEGRAWDIIAADANRVAVRRVHDRPRAGGRIRARRGRRLRAAPLVALRAAPGRRDRPVERPARLAPLRAAG